jgi:glycosyltransferase involved in cell wall biosynthesis
LVSSAIVVSFPIMEKFGGGSKRNFHVLKKYPQLGLETYLYVPFRYLLTIILNEVRGGSGKKTALDSFKELEKEGINISQYTYEILEEYKYKKQIETLSRNDPFCILLRRLFMDFQTLKNENELINRFLKSIHIKDITFVYSQHEVYNSVYCAFTISKKISKPLFILLQLEPYKISPYRFRTILEANGRNVRNLPYLAYDFLIKNYDFRRYKSLYEKICSSDLTRGILSVSSSPLILSRLDEVARRYDVNTVILRPAIAYNKKILEYRSSGKRYDAVFYARLTPEKGILELPYIWKKVLEIKPTAKLLVFGSFQPYWTKEAFFRVVGDLGIDRNIEYCGFVDEKELFSSVAGSKVLIYPSHSDAFAMVLLEALALRTSVVAQEIPGVSDVYSGLKAIHLVREGDLKAMANEVVKILNMDHLEYFEEHENDKVENFIKIHDSWEEVAKSELTNINTLIKGKI